jgi:DNA polymerase-3 subunit delta
MRLKPEQLASHFGKGLAPVYVLTGEEPLQLLEAADAIRARARQDGYVDRQVMNVDKSFDWNTVTEASNSLSLFAERRLLDLRMPGKPGDAGSKALLAYAERPPEDTVLLLECGKLDKATTGKAKWFQALDKLGVVIQVWPVEAPALPDWIQNRMRTRGMQPSRDAVTMLAERIEGNLLAAAQEIEKLLLLHGPGRIDVDNVAASVADSARFNVFGLVDSALAGKTVRVARMLSGLRGEGVAPLLISWALSREIRSLAAMAGEVAQGVGIEAVLARHRVWERRKPLLRVALKRHSRERWYALVLGCGHLERVIKGAAAGNPWDELLQLGLMLSGVMPLRASQASVF